MERIHNLLSKLNNEDFKKKSITNAGNLGYKIFRFVLLFALCFIIIHPVLYMTSVSIRETADLYDPTVIWIPKNFTLQNFISTIETMDYFRLFGNTLFFSLVGTFLNIASCALAGYGFARFNFKFKGLIFTFLLFMIIVPPQVVSIPLYLQYSKFDFFGFSWLLEKVFGVSAYVNLLNTPLTIFIPAIFGNGLRSGFLIYMFRQFFRNMPAALEDAASIDGCGIFTSFLRIIIPNASGSFLVACLLSFVWYYNDFFFTSMYFSETPTLSVGLAGLRDMLRILIEADTNSDPYSYITQLQAGSLLVIIPLIVVFVFLQKRFIKSIESSGIVG